MVAIAFVVPLAVLVDDVAEDRALENAGRDASALFPVLAVTGEVEPVAVAVSRTPAGAAGRMAVHLPSGPAVGADLGESDRLDAALAEGRAWTGRVPGGVEVISPVVRPDGGIAVIRVLVPDEVLNDGVVRAWLALAGVGAGLVVGSVLLADRLARSVTRPVATLAEASARLGRGELDTRVEPAGPPEIAEVGAAFNHLAGRIGDLLENEREDVADLAHRLRTPLAALRLEVDRITDPELRDDLARSADQLSRSLDQVIEEARRRTRIRTTRADVVAVVTDRAAFWQPLAEDQGRPTGLVVPGGPLHVAADETELAATMDVLIENVFSHTPESTGYRILVDEADGLVRVVVEDDGPGIGSVADLERGTSSHSTGLGLDIARRTVEAGGGELRVDEGLTGARIVLRLPRVD